MSKKLNVCKTCEYWDKNTIEKTLKNTLVNKCNCKKFMFYSHPEYMEADELFFDSYESYHTHFFVGEEFGCIHNARTKINKCKTCEYWDERNIKETLKKVNFSTCICPKIRESRRPEYIGLDEMMYCDDEGYITAFWTAESFGCVHHAVRPWRPETLFEKHFLRSE